MIIMFLVYFSCLVMFGFRCDLACFNSALFQVELFWESVRLHSSMRLAQILSSSIGLFDLLWALVVWGALCGYNET